MWSDDEGPYEGKHYQLAETICPPPPIQQPGPPIMIGGSGERKTLRLVAQYGDACNLFATTPAEVAHKLEVLAAALRRPGPRSGADREDHRRPARPARRRRRVHVAAWTSTPKLGIELVELTPRVDDPADWVARVCEAVVPLLNELPD